MNVRTMIMCIQCGHAFQYGPSECPKCNSRVLMPLQRIADGTAKLTQDLKLLDKIVKPLAV